MISDTCTNIMVFLDPKMSISAKYVYKHHVGSTIPSCIVMVLPTQSKVMYTVNLYESVCV